MSSQPPSVRFTKHAIERLEDRAEGDIDWVVNAIYSAIENGRVKDAARGRRKRWKNKVVRIDARRQGHRYRIVLHTEVRRNLFTVLSIVDPAYDRAQRAAA